MLLGLGGVEYHGPDRHLGFLPRITPEHFRAAFTTADGWGTYEQTQQGDSQVSRLEVKWGQVALRSLALESPDGKPVKSVTLECGDAPMEVTVSQQEGRVSITLADELVISADKQLKVTIVS